MSVTGPFVIGIDGGASKTAAMIVSAEGVVVSRRRVGASAIVGRPHAEALATLSGVTRSLVQDAGIALEDVHRVALGLSGIDYDDEIRDQTRDITAALGLKAEQLLLVNDGLAALAGATPCARAVMVQHGTEVTLAYRASVGDGQVFDSVGIADCFDLRHRAIPLVARMLDGRAAVSSLRTAVLEHCGVPAHQFGGWIRRNKAAALKAILSLAPVVFDRWASRDEAAEMLIQGAAKDYVVAAAAMGRRIGPGPFVACFGGGVIKAGGAAFLTVIERHLAAACPEAVMAEPILAPESGAALLGLRDIGPSHDVLFRRLRIAA